MTKVPSTSATERAVRAFMTPLSLSGHVRIMHGPSRRPRFNSQWRDDDAAARVRVAGTGDTVATENNDVTKRGMRGPAA